MYCGCAAPEEGIKNPPGVPGRCSKISVFVATVPKLFQNGVWPIFISYPKVMKTKKNHGFFRGFYGCGGRTRTYDLRVMRADFRGKHRILSSINIEFLYFLYLNIELFCNSVLRHFVPCDPKVTQKEEGLYRHGKPASNWPGRYL